jgi:hypothetical protein
MIDIIGDRGGAVQELAEQMKKTAHMFRRATPEVSIIMVPGADQNMIKFFEQPVKLIQRVGHGTFMLSTLNQVTCNQQNIISTVSITAQLSDKPVKS